MTSDLSVGISPAMLPDRMLTLIPAKLRPPLPRNNWVERLILASRLEAGAERRLTLISAPAGYGKTTVVSQWIHSHHEDSAWITLDRYDDSLEVFLRYFAAALRAAVPKFTPTLDGYLSAPYLPRADYFAEIVVTELENIKRPIRIVLDDYHNITSNEIQSFVVRLLECAPRQFHLVVISRSDPPWPLVRWRVSGWITEFRIEDCRFTVEEARSFFDRSGRLLDPVTIESFYDQCEGWITGLQLLQLSTGGGIVPDSFKGRITGGREAVFQYLVEEVVSRQPAKMKELLAVSAVPDRFCAALCDRLLNVTDDVPDSDMLIEKIKKENLFLISLDNENVWHRYHHLFRGALLRQFKRQVPSERLARLHSLAGEWFAGEKLVEEALHHFLAAGEFGAAAALVEEHMHEIIDRDIARRELSHWLDLFPPSVQERHPALLIARAYVAVARWDSKTALPLLDRAEELLRDPVSDVSDDRRRSLEGDVAVQRAIFLFWAGDGANAVRHSLRAQQLVPRQHRYAHNLAIVCAAAGYSLLGRRDRSLQLLADALADDCALGGHYSEQLYHANAALYYFAGELADTVTHARKILALDEVVHTSDYYRGYALHLIAIAEYERNNLDAVAEHLSLVEASCYRGNIRVHHDCRVGLALVAIAQGDADRARACAASARAFATEVQDAYCLAISDSFEAKLDFLLGKRQSAPPLARDVVHSNKFYFELPPLTRAEYWLADPSPANCCAALEVIEEGLRNAGRHHHTYQTIQFLALKAVAQWLAGSREDALETIRKSLALAKPRGFVRSFVDRGAGMQRLLQELVETGSGDDYVRGLLNAFTTSGSSASAADAVVDAAQLSNRELDVLLMLAERLTNKEIAQRLFVSSETVKKHTSSIYRKLGVRGRREAVSAARRLGPITRR